MGKIEKNTATKSVTCKVLQQITHDARQDVIYANFVPLPLYINTNRKFLG